MYDVFEPSDVEWRGFPVFRNPVRLKKEFEQYDAQKKFGIVYRKVSKHSACICDRVSGVLLSRQTANFSEKSARPGPGWAVYGKPRGGLQNMASLPD